MIMSQSEEVQTKVLNALYWDLAVPPHRVKVEVENGWVTISGTVDRYYQRTLCRIRRAQGCWRARRQQSYSACVGERGARGHAPVAIAAAPPARLTPPNDYKRFGIAVVVNLISTALRTQSGRRTVKYRLTEVATSWDQARPAVQARRAKALSKERMC